MRISTRLTGIFIGISVLAGPIAASAQDSEPVDEATPDEEAPDAETAEEEAEEESAESEAAASTQPTQAPEQVGEPEDYGPALPDGMSLDDVLDIAQESPPADFPRTIPDDRFYLFVLGEQLEYRLEDVSGEGELGWEVQAWAGGDLNKIWLKTEGEAALLDPQGIESETDLLYSRLISTFWNLQAGAQYANEWAAGAYEDRWSGAIAFQGMAPGSFEVDASFYLSEALDVTASLSVEYDLRITQRLVLQPHAEFGLSAQEVPERGLGVGLTGFDLDGRLRYEISRKFAPYLGVRYSLLTFGTAEFAEDAGDAPASFMVLAGLRFAI